MSASTLELLSTKYYATNPNTWVAVTGLFIEDIKIMKSGMKWMFQNATLVDLTPHNFEFNLHAMSKETLPFILPVAFTIGPSINTTDDKNLDKSSVKKYALFLSKKEAETEKIIKGIIEGETRVLAATMTIVDLFNDRIKFKTQIIEKIDEELKQFGLRVFNANIRELQDTQESTYFKNTVKKILAEAENQAKIDVACATMKGDIESNEKETTRLVKISELKANSVIGQKSFEMKTRSDTATYESKAICTENQQKEEITKSETKLKILKSEQLRETQLAEIITKKDTELKELEMAEKNSQARIKSNMEELKSKILVETRVKAESLVETVTAESKAIQLKADAKLYEKEKEAEGIKKMYNAQAEGMKTLIDSFKGDMSSVLTYMMMKDNQFTKLAEINSKAIQDLKPNITVWNTSSDGSNGTTDVIRNIMQSIPPLFNTIQEQTGIKILPGIIENKGKTVTK